MSPGPLFWVLLAWIPGGSAVIAGLLSAMLWPSLSISMAVQHACHVFVAVCFTIASSQCVNFSWWQARVEGKDLGYPAWVHQAAGVTEIVVVGLRIMWAWNHCGVAPTDSDDELGSSSLAVATTFTCCIMGGAVWTWCIALPHKMHGVVPAALVLAATLVTRPQGYDIWFGTAFGVGFLAAAILRRIHNQASFSRKVD